jgi:hypothetical protein
MLFVRHARGHRRVLQGERQIAEQCFHVSLLPTILNPGVDSRVKHHLSCVMGAYLTIGQVAASTGESRDTIRYYERIGLVPKTDQDPCRYRQYRDGVSSIASP